MFVADRSPDNLPGFDFAVVDTFLDNREWRSRG